MLTKEQAQSILNLALELERTGRISSLAEGQEKTDMIHRNRAVQVTLEEYIEMVTEKDMACPSPSEIYDARKEAQLTQAEAADLIHSKLRTWQDWEAGKAKMHAGLWELFLLKLEERKRLQGN